MTPKEQLTRAIILALHPECKTYEEAAMVEIGIGCMFKVSDLGMFMHKASTFIYKIIDYKNNPKGGVLDKVYLCTQRGWAHSPNSGFLPKEGYPEHIELYYSHKDQACSVKNKYNDLEIIGLPLSLARVLAALGDEVDYFKISNSDGCLEIQYLEETFFNWQLTKEGIELTLEDQTPETIDVLLALFNS